MVACILCRFEGRVVEATHVWPDYLCEMHHREILEEKSE